MSRLFLALLSFGICMPAWTSAPHARVNSTTYVFVCDDQHAYTVRVTGDTAWIFRPEGTLHLEAGSDSQGTTYHDDNFVLQIVGETARFGAPGSTPRVCRNDRSLAIWEKSKLDGADFRAVGNEPGWSLEIFEKNRAVLVTGYGASRIERLLPQPAVNQQARTTRWDAGDMIVELTGKTCHDSMTGEPFETTVVVIWNGQTLRGCGRPLH